MDLQLVGKRAVVTGSTAGIGFAIAEALAKEGCFVVVNGRTEQRVGDAIKKLQTSVARGKFEGIAADVGTAEGADKLARLFQDADILVNNAGIFEAKAFEQISDDDWKRLFEVNVLSGVRLSRHYLPGMKKRDWGRIVFISSESAVQIPAEMIHYGMTKTAQLAIARGLAETTAGTKVTVNSVLPGPTLSEGVGQFVADLAKRQDTDTAKIEREFFTNVRPSSLIKRFATTEEVANMIVYVVSDAASATNGAALRVDGG